MSKKLLLADDSVTIQKVIEITFANEDYDLTIVGNGDEALEKAKLNPPDLILADIIMPGKNGYELCSEIKNMSGLAQTPVLLLVGSFEPFDEEKARSVGADSWIAKPFESQALIEKVQELLDKPPQPVQMPAMPPVPSLEEKEAELEKIIPFETAASFETAPSVEAAAKEEFSTEQVASVEESFTVETEEIVSEPVFEEPKEPAPGQPAAEPEELFVSFDAEPAAPTPPAIEEPASFEFTEPAVAEASLVPDEQVVSFDAEPAAPPPPAIEEPASFELEEPAAAEVSVEPEEQLVSFAGVPVVPTPPAIEEPASFEFEEPAEEAEELSVSFETETTVPPAVEGPAAFEFEEPEAVQSQVEIEEPFAAVEADSVVVSAAPEELSPVEIETGTVAGGLPVEEAEEDDDEEILLLNEDDIFEEAEAPDVVEEEAPAVVEEKALEEDSFTLDSDVVLEPAPSETEEFFENLPESSFDIEPEEEETSIVLHRPLGAFSFDESDEISAGPEEEQSIDTPVVNEVAEEQESDREFSFADLDDGLPEEEELSIEPEELDSSEAAMPAEAEEKPQIPTYAQMEQKVHSLTDAQLYAIVEKVAGATIERMAKEILEEVAWEVVPNLSENIIKEEIQKIKAAQ